ncbi:hypothetical protein [Roseomonas elaeocarpi]|uniref:GcrA cell cycle regulator n=1 Tax=Roseomonas elaeocarpi TaxID=907779 RepID=A0ABV6K057_9PROT
MAKPLSKTELLIVKQWNDSTGVCTLADRHRMSFGRVLTILNRAARAGMHVDPRDTERKQRLPKITPAEVDARMDIVRLRLPIASEPAKRQHRPFVSVCDRVPDPLAPLRRGPPALPETAQRFR